MRRFSWIVVASLLVAASNAASAAVITFEAAPPGPFVSYTDQGATFTASGGVGQILRLTNPNGTQGIVDDNTPRFELRADIAGGASMVAVDLGDFNADPDTIFLEIFDAANMSLGFTSLLLSGADSTMHTLSLSAPNIDHAIFGARNPAANGSSVFADNFTFAPAAVPEPMSMALFGGLAVVGLVGYRRRQAKA